MKYREVLKNPGRAKRFYLYQISKFKFYYYGEFELLEKWIDKIQLLFIFLDIEKMQKNKYKVAKSRIMIRKSFIELKIFEKNNIKFFNVT